MSRVFVHGVGAVSPAGWGAPALITALQRGEPLPAMDLPRPGWTKPLRVHPVPPPASRPAFLGHPRLRRSSAISQYTVAAALEAVGEDCPRVQQNELTIGTIICLMAGCVTYSRRFYEEVLKDPSVASPLLFPETVFNAPGSHLAAYLNSRAPSYTLVGDDTCFLQALAMAADWLATGKMDGCLVIGAEEPDWLVADALQHFPGHARQASGAGAVYLRSEQPPRPAAELSAITDVIPFPGERARGAAVAQARSQLPTSRGSELLCLSLRDASDDDPEAQVWKDWTGQRLAPKQLFGDAFAASAAWQCIAACDALTRNEFSAANVSVVGANQNAGAARFIRSEPVNSP